MKANAARFLLRFPQLEHFAQRTEAMVATYLRVLVKRGLCSVEPSGEEPRSIHYPQLYAELVNKAYRELAANPDLPFPNEIQLGVDIPPSVITDVNIKSDFVSVLEGMQTEGPAILRLVFPELINPILITPELVRTKLLELTVHKARQFLSLRNNAGYVTHRLHTILRGHEHALRDIINVVMSRPGRAVGTLLEPSDFSFRFWAHFANLLLQEYKERADKLAEEHSYCQAAYLIGFYNVQYRGRQQLAMEKEGLVRKFEAQFRKYPYAYTLKDLYALRDDKGMPLVRKNTKDTFTAFLESKLKNDDAKGIPEVVRLKSVSAQEYYIHRELLIPLFVKILHEKEQELRDSYLEEWVELVKQNRRVPAMSDDAEFERDLDLALRNRYPLLYSLLNSNLLFLAREVSKLDYDMAKTMDRVLDPKRGVLNPLPRVVGLDRRDLLASAKLRVPLYQRLSLFKNLFYFFQRVLRGLRAAAHQVAVEGGLGAAHRRSESPAGKGAGQTEANASELSGAGGSRESANGGSHVTTLRPTSASQLAAYRKALHRLKLELVGSDNSIPESLQELVERWNPLYDAHARTELVLDVNAMIRDYFRTLKRTFGVGAPSAARIRGLAAKLAENKSFERIKRKDLFTRYIEIYMLKLLGDR